MSKIGINAATGIQQRDFDQETTRSGIVVSAMCPGYCKTEMTGGGGIFTAEQGYLIVEYFHFFKFVTIQETAYRRLIFKRS
jgi:NAD(P)-dependent dehydrogenase (short-subunit alcohol dehydrogenase family)